MLDEQGQLLDRDVFAATNIDQRRMQTGTFVQNAHNVILAAIFWLLDAIFLLYPLGKNSGIKAAK